MPVPRARELDDLPYVSHLRPFRGEPTGEGDYDSAHAEGATWEETEAGRSRFTQCTFSSMTATGGRYRRARFNDVWLHTVRWLGADLAETEWLDAEIIGGAFAGLEMFGAKLRRVTFHHCKIDSVNARGAHLHDVAFVDCLLRDVDFGGAALTGVTFPGSRLEGVRCEKARMERVDLRDATALGIVAGHEALGGATITSAQLLDLAPAFAHALGVTVKDG